MLSFRLRLYLPNDPSQDFRLKYNLHPCFDRVLQLLLLLLLLYVCVCNFLSTRARFVNGLWAVKLALK
jgi:hypothetical protein